jgi:glycosyltransferase involved in cell wall biosynthesis
MQAGLAILSNDLDFVRSVIDAYGCGLVYRANDSRTIVAAVDRLVQDEAFRRHCQENARRAAVSEYHWQKQSEPLYRAYATFAATPCPAS